MPTAQAEPLKIVIDFDSTFTKVEGLDELARIALQGNPKQAEIVGKIALASKQVSTAMTRDVESTSESFRSTDE